MEFPANLKRLKLDYKDLIKFIRADAERNQLPLLQLLLQYVLSLQTDIFDIMFQLKYISRLQYGDLVGEDLIKILESLDPQAFVEDEQKILTIEDLENAAYKILLAGKIFPHISGHLNIEVLTNRISSTDRVRVINAVKRAFAWPGRDVNKHYYTEIRNLAARYNLYDQMNEDAVHTGYFRLIDMAVFIGRYGLEDSPNRLSSNTWRPLLLEIAKIDGCRDAVVAGVALNILLSQEG